MILPGGARSTSAWSGGPRCLGLRRPGGELQPGFSEVAKYIIMGPPTTPCLHQPVDLMDLTVSMAKWNALREARPGDRARRDAPALVGCSTRYIQKENVSAWDKYKEKGVQIIRLSEADIQKFRRHAIPMWFKCGQAGRAGPGGVRVPARVHEDPQRRVHHGLDAGRYRRQDEADPLGHALGWRLSASARKPSRRPSRPACDRPGRSRASSIFSRACCIAPPSATQFSASEPAECSRWRGIERSAGRVVPLERAEQRARSSSSSTTKWLSPPEAMTATDASLFHSSIASGDGLADRERAARRRLVRQVAGVLEHREDRAGLVVEEPLDDEARTRAAAPARAPASRARSRARPAASDSAARRARRRAAST